MPTYIDYIGQHPSNAPIDVEWRYTNPYGLPGNTYPTGGKPGGSAAREAASLRRPTPPVPKAKPTVTPRAGLLGKLGGALGIGVGIGQGVNSVIDAGTDMGWWFQPDQSKIARPNPEVVKRIQSEQYDKYREEKARRGFAPQSEYDAPVSSDSSVENYGQMRLQPVTGSSQDNMRPPPMSPGEIGQERYVESYRDAHNRNMRTYDSMSGRTPRPATIRGRVPSDGGIDDLIGESNAAYARNDYKRSGMASRGGTGVKLNMYDAPRPYIDQATQPEYVPSDWRSDAEGRRAHLAQISAGNRSGGGQFSSRNGQSAGPQGGGLLSFLPSTEQSDPFRGTMNGGYPQQQQPAQDRRGEVMYGSGESMLQRADREATQNQKKAEQSDRFARSAQARGRIVPYIEQAMMGQGTLPQRKPLVDYGNGSYQSYIQQGATPAIAGQLAEQQARQQYDRGREQFARQIHFSNKVDAWRENNPGMPVTPEVEAQLRREAGFVDDAPQGGQASIAPSAPVNPKVRQAVTGGLPITPETAPKMKQQLDALVANAQSQGIVFAPGEVDALRAEIDAKMPLGQSLAEQQRAADEVSRRAWQHVPPNYVPTRPNDNMPVSFSSASGIR